jgi:GT2 family glycosyltransferase
MSGVGPELSVVVVTYNSAHVVGELLDSLPAALGAISADVVVVDNGSTDGTVEVLTGRADCRVIAATNRGYAAGINRGVREGAPAEAALVLNPDVRLMPGAVRPLLAALRLPGTGVVAPMVREPGGALSRSLRREPSLGRAIGLNRTGLPAFSEYLARPAEYATPRVVDWALGAVLLMSRACFDAVGGWDESYFLYSEETDFSLRARDLGFLTRYEPAAVAIHIGGQSGQSPQTHAMQIVNRVRLYRRRHGPVATWLYYALTVASELTWAVRAGARSRFAVRVLLRPSLRPAALGCSDRFIPT